MLYEAYKAQMHVNREFLIEEEQLVTLPAADLQFFARLPQQLHVVVLTEDWCGAALESIPGLARLAAESGKLKLRFFLRDQNPDLMDQYVKDGVHRTIPTFVFFDHDFGELGCWRERVAKIQEMWIEMKRELFATDLVFAGLPMDTAYRELSPEAQRRLGEAFDNFWNVNRALSNSELVREIRTVVERGLATERSTRSR